MTPPELPEDMRSWPNNPFELLGIKPGDDEVNIKRAYLKLARRFKPEHAPEQFRRIREAYDHCLLQNSWYRPEIPDAEAETRIPLPEEQEPIIVSQAVPSVPIHELLDTPKTLDEDEILWNAAIAGDLASAYAGYCLRISHHGDHPDIPLRLYWLLLLDPSLDPHNSRHTWLDLALRNSRLNGTSVELYQRELEDDPHRALIGPYIDLLKIEVDEENLYRVLRLRISAANRVGAELRVLADLGYVRERMIQNMRFNWMSLMGTLAEWSIAKPSKQFHDYIRCQVDDLQDMHLQHGYHFDRIDEAIHLGELMKSIYNGLVPVEMIAVVAAMRAEGTCSISRVEAAADALLIPETMAVFFAPTLEGLPAYVAQCLVHAFDRYLDDFVPADAEHRTERLLDSLSSRFTLASRRDRTYHSMRKDLLSFLIRFAIDPREFARGYEQRYQDSDFTNDVYNDLGLRTIWLAQRISASFEHVR